MLSLLRGCRCLSRRHFDLVVGCVLEHAADLSLKTGLCGVVVLVPLLSCLFLCSEVVLVLERGSSLFFSQLEVTPPHKCGGCLKECEEIPICCSQHPGTQKIRGLAAVARAVFKNSDLLLRALGFVKAKWEYVCLGSYVPSRFLLCSKTVPR